jgi:hypothetical protein
MALKNGSKMTYYQQYPEVSSQKYWNMMEIFSEKDIDEIWSEIQKKLKNMADFSKIIIDHQTFIHSWKRMKLQRKDTTRSTGMT